MPKKKEDETPKNQCLCGKDMSVKHKTCFSPAECRACGFEPHEAARRKQMIRDGGLRENHWGGRTLFLGRTTEGER